MVLARRALYVVTLLLAETVLLIAPARAEDCFRIATPAGAGGTGEMSQITIQVFKEAGLCVEMLRLPPKRIAGVVAAREADGWVQAVTADDKPPGVILLANDLGRLEGTLYWPAGSMEPAGSDSAIGAVLGQAWAQLEVQRRKAKLYEVRDNKQLLSMASTQRLRGFLIPAITYQHFLVDFPELRSYNRRLVADLRIRIALRPGLESIVPRLETAAKQTVEEGFPQQVWQRYLQEKPGTMQWDNRP